MRDAQSAMHPGEATQQATVSRCINEVANNRRLGLHMTLTGGCQCGAVRYQVSAEPLQVYVCHCRECQKQSASAFGISVIVPAEAFILKQGNVRTWSRPTDSGNVLHCTFCAVCGTRIHHTSPGETSISIKGGSLDEPPDLTTAFHIWTARKLPGVVIPDGARQYPGEPD